MPVIDLFGPDDLNRPVDPPILGNYDLKFLAQGDSWFSIGAMHLPMTSNLFDEMEVSRPACVVNCAVPGQILDHMTDKVDDPKFLNLLNGKAALTWSGLLMSGGGNDMIDVLRHGPGNDAGNRLLATRDEWTTAVGGDRYLSNAGWAKFATHIEAVVREKLLPARDAGPNRGIPVVMHTYDYLMPRPSPAAPGSGPWLEPAVRMFGIPPADWFAVGQALLNRLRTLLQHVAATTPDGSVHIVDTLGALTPAAATDGGPTGDWNNEIHPTPAGYRKLNRKWTPVLDQVFASRLRGPMTPDGGQDVGIPGGA